MVIVVVSVISMADAVWGLIVEGLVVVGGGWLIVRGGGMGRGRGVMGKVKVGVGSGSVGCIRVEGGEVVGRG